MSTPPASRPKSPVPPPAPPPARRPGRARDWEIDAQPRGIGAPLSVSVGMRPFGSHSPRGI
jgi:hypothetical protein